MILEMVGTISEEMPCGDPFIDHVVFKLKNGRRIRVDRDRTEFFCEKEEDGTISVDICFRSLYLLKDDGTEIYTPNEYAERLNKIVLDADIEVIIEDDCEQDGFAYTITEWAIYV